ncbi:hypothetical protein H4582DRAFT_1238946 [Lactarius indigo]|nr:hypothetical protein H4582DRAFT_1238946 [Lactarius indigo]
MVPAAAMRQHLILNFLTPLTQLPSFQPILVDIAMPRRTRRRSDPERGEQLSLQVDEIREESWSGSSGRGLEPDAGPGGGAMNNSSDGPAQSERKDFDDGANALWSLYNKEGQTHDEALFQGLLADMSGIPTFMRRVLPRVDLPAYLREQTSNRGS